MTTLSYIIVDDVEKPGWMLQTHLDNLAAFTDRADRDRLQVVILSQHVTPRPVVADFDIEVVHAGHEMADGYPIWDICEPMGRMLPSLAGDYVTLQHSENWWRWDRMKRTLAALGERPATIVLGNLRRIGQMEWLGPEVRGDAVAGKAFNRVVQAGDQYAADHAALWLPTAPWSYQHGEPVPGPCELVEDMAFVRRDWLEAVCFFDHGYPQPFTEPWEHLDGACQVLAQKDMAPSVFRLPLETCEVVHLHHDRLRQAYSAAVRDWFLSDPPRWRGTRCADPAIWHRLTAHPADSIHQQVAISGWRYGERGTARRWCDDFACWLNTGGALSLADTGLWISELAT